jgi:pilus assembly protein Flp/PilA
MNQLLKLIVAIQLRAQEFGDKERGATATEYAILVAFIAVVIVVGVTAFGSQLNTFFNGLGAKVGIIS